MSDRRAVRDALQAGYGDATQTVLDDQVAGDVIAVLRERGWASLIEVAAIIEAAGGEVRVTPRHMPLDEMDVEVITFEDHATLERVFRTRRRSEHTP